MTAPAPDIDPRFAAGTDLLGRTGARSFQLRYSDDEAPTVWFATALYDEGRWECAAGHDPVEAVLRLCGQVVDGGICTHCNRPTMLATALDEPWPLLVEQVMCVYQWDPELATFRRSCEGETTS